jgi:isopentenyldiphosphate isomerase
MSPPPEPGDETVMIVDRDNRPLGTASRRSMRIEGLVHRATYIFVLDEHGQLFLQQRTETKDVYPGWQDAAAGGVVLADEDYDTSAAREVEEELGIRGAPLEPCFDFWFEDGEVRTWGRTYLCRHAGPFRLQPEEVTAGRFVPVREVLAGTVGRVTPDTLVALRRLVAEGRIPAR